MKSHPTRQVSFLTQALLIAIPLAILSVVALFSLRLDRTAIEQDARENARALAPQLAQSMGQNLSKSIRDLPDRPHQGLIIRGQIVFPVDYPRLPVPPDWPAQLNSLRTKVWRTAEEALFQKKDLRAAKNALAEMRTAGLPQAALANTEFGLLLLESGEGKSTNLVRQLADLARRYRGVHTESGTPLADLALIQALRRSPAREPLPDLLKGEISNRVQSYPSFLTPELLEAASRVQPDLYAAQRVRWAADEETRTLLRALLQQPMGLKSPGEIWFEDQGREYLALCSPALSTGIHVQFISARRIEELFRAAVPSGRGGVPAYAGIVIEMGTRRWSVSEGNTTAALPAGEVLASAAGRLSTAEPTGLPAAAIIDRLMKSAPGTNKETQDQPFDAGAQVVIPSSGSNSRTFVLSLTLSRPDMLYTGYRQRLWLIAGLVLAATAAAGMGLAGAWRAFRRQQQLAEMTSNFVSGVSHELRAPLASVRLMAESLDQDRVTDDEKRRGYFRLIVQECRRLSSLVENVLDFSRIRQGSKRYEYEPVDLETMLRQTVELLVPNAGERNVSLVLSEQFSDDQEYQPRWDGQAIQQALVNLIDNAIKHAPPQTAVKVDCKPVTDSRGSMIHLSVEDQGPGIPAEEQERIFEPFYRRGSELHRETRGIGIGLSLVKHIAEAHGGRVLVESAPGQGSRFTLALPVETEQRLIPLCGTQ